MGNIVISQLDLNKDLLNDLNEEEESLIVGGASASSASASWAFVDNGDVGAGSVTASVANGDGEVGIRLYPFVWRWGAEIIGIPIS